MALINITGKGYVEIPGTNIAISMDIIYSLIVIILSLIFLAVYRRILLRLVESRVLDRVYYDRIYRVTQLVVAIIAFLAVIYYMTGEHVLIYIIAGLVIIIAASSWEIIANIVSFYVILFSRLVTRGDYVMLPNGSHGRVREITLLYSLVETPQGVYAVPNLEFVRRGRLQFKEPSYIRVTIRIWGFEDPEVVEDLRSIVHNTIEEASREVLAHTGAIRVYVDEISMDSVVLKAVIPVPGPRPNIARLTSMLIELANALKETGYSYTIGFEMPEGYEQRWRSVG
ncbi:MAG: mechanosensitive ion channel [Desulfurococcales archaeon]|nr:mechanosensitive ion channel [Desulfurococcales archaeon]